MAFVAALATNAAAADARKGETLALVRDVPCRGGGSTGRHYAIARIFDDCSQPRLQRGNACVIFIKPAPPNAGYEFVAKRSG
jgi:hypothetical protein